MNINLSMCTVHVTVLVFFLNVYLCVNPEIP